jgi:hypothetical protein
MTRRGQWGLTAVGAAVPVTALAAPAGVPAFVWANEWGMAASLVVAAAAFVARRGAPAGTTSGASRPW